MKTKLDEFTEEEIIEILNNSLSFRQVLKKIGYSLNGSGAYASLKNQLKKRKIDIPKYHYYGNGNNTGKDLNEILVENSEYTNRGRLKIRLVNEKILEYVCSDCGNKGEWNGKKLVLQLEHKNGINNDNRLENLAFLCPNCHSQTKTYAGNNVKKNIKKNRSTSIKRKRIQKYCKCGKGIYKDSNMCVECAKINQRRVERPTFKQLLEDIEKLGYTGTGRKYNVSDNAIRRWKKFYEK